jgi:hypothetical protein
MILVIPTVEDQPYYSFRIRLEGRDFTFSVTYSTRQDLYYLTISDADNAELVSGLKLVTNWPLLEYYQANPAAPQGELFAMSTTGDVTPARFGELAVGKRVELTYFETADALEFRASRTASTGNA